MRLWQGSFSEADFARMTTIRRVHGHGAEAEAVRFAVREQAARSAGPVTEILRGLYEQAAESCVEMRGRWQRANVSAEAQERARESNAARHKLTRWSFRCDEADLDRMDAVARRHGLRKRAEAVRFALFVQAALDGFPVNRRASRERVAASQ